MNGTRRPHSVFVRDIGPTFTFATAERAHARAAELTGPTGEFCEVVVCDRNAWSREQVQRTVYRHGQDPVVEQYDHGKWLPVGTSAAVASVSL